MTLREHIISGTDDELICMESLHGYECVKAKNKSQGHNIYDLILIKLVGRHSLNLYSGNYHLT